MASIDSTIKNEVSQHYLEKISDYYCFNYAQSIILMSIQRSSYKHKISRTNKNFQIVVPVKT